MKFEIKVKVYCVVLNLKWRKQWLTKQQTNKSDAVKWYEEMTVRSITSAVEDNTVQMILSKIYDEFKEETRNLDKMN